MYDYVISNGNENPIPFGTTVCQDGITFQQALLAVGSK